MKKYLTISEMMKVLKISPSKYKHFKMWCYRHHEKLDTQDCKWNHGYYLYNVALVREKCPYIAVENADKVSTPETPETPVETPLDAAERLAAAINTATGKNITGVEVLDHCNRMTDYIRMRRTMARVLWRMRKERRTCETHCRNYRESCKMSADFTSEYLNRAFDVSRNAEKAARMMNVIMFTIFVICVVTIGTVYEIVN